MSRWNDRVQAAIFDPNKLAPTYPESAITKPFPFNAFYSEAEAPRVDAAGYKLALGGLIRDKAPWNLEQLYALPQESQITRHICVEGWSAIGKWQGPQLGKVLEAAGLLPNAKYAVFHCADVLEGAPYYESIDLVDAFHPQTILAWRMNDTPLDEAHGAPLRLRVERQLGYKQAKYVMRIELTETLAGLYGGGGGHWEDARGYQWYAGI
jgi:DMSO/TMAO reductase YedYZ molybdopterin-dependent catalytic subunit